MKCKGKQKKKETPSHPWSVEIVSAKKLLKEVTQLKSRKIINKIMRMWIRVMRRK